MANLLVELEGVTRVFARGRQWVRAMEGVDLTIEEGEVVAVVGPSGSGKTTLLNVMAGLDHPTSGRVRMRGRELSAMGSASLAALRRRNIGFIFQFYNLLPYLSAVENVEVPMMLGRVPKAVRRARALELLVRLGLQDRLDHRPEELSGGEQQRVAIARALANGPSLILGDEPTGDLDSASAREVMGLLQCLNQEEGITIVLVTHDPLVASSAHRVVSMRDGRVVEGRRLELPTIMV